MQYLSNLTEVRYNASSHTAQKALGGMKIMLLFNVKLLFSNSCYYAQEIEKNRMKNGMISLHNIFF